MEYLDIQNIHRELVSLELNWNVQGKILNLTTIFSKSTLFTFLVILMLHNILTQVLAFILDTSSHRGNNFEFLLWIH